MARHGVTRVDENGIAPLGLADCPVVPLGQFGRQDQMHVVGHRSGAGPERRSGDETADERPCLKTPGVPGVLAFSRHFYLQIIGTCAIMPSKNGKAAERPQLNEADMEKRRAFPPKGGPTREAMRANRAGERKNALGGPRKSLITLDSDKQIQAFPLVGFGRAWPDLAQFGFGFGFSLDVVRYTSVLRI